jgi:hypothetical protein
MDECQTLVTGASAGGADGAPPGTPVAPGAPVMTVHFVSSPRSPTAGAAHESTSHLNLRRFMSRNYPTYPPQVAQVKPISGRV